MNRRMPVRSQAARAGLVWSAGCVMAAAVVISAFGCSSRAASRPAASADGRFAPAPNQVSLKTSDGWTIIGDLYAPKGRSRGAVVLLHQRGGSADDWQPLARALQASGITALAIDQRGAGRSVHGPGPMGADAPWDTSPDIDASIHRLRGAGAVGLAGASYGANNGLIYAAAHPGSVKAVALFSPGVDYHGLQSLAPAKAYRGALLIYHDRDDSIAGDGPRMIDSVSPSHDHALHVLNGGAHGTALLSREVVDQTVAFFRGTLRPSG